MADSIAMFPAPIRGRFFRVNLGDLDDKPVIDVAVQALGVHQHVGLASAYTHLLILEQVSKKLFWIEKDEFTADSF